MEQKPKEQERTKKSSNNTKDENVSASSDKDKNTNGSVSSRDKSPTLTRKKSFFQTNPPEPWEIFNKEKCFILDCIAVKTIYEDSARTNPRLGHIIPPYNSQKDKHAGAYFKFKDVDKVLQLNNQSHPGTAIEGQVAEKFYDKWKRSSYLYLRNRNGAGHSREYMCGHDEYSSPNFTERKLDWEKNLPKDPILPYINPKCNHGTLLKR